MKPVEMHSTADKYFNIHYVTFRSSRMSDLQTA